MELDKLIIKIIPPSDYQHRNGFDNKGLIDELTFEEKQIVEDLLINRLMIESQYSVDTLVVETLSYLKSEKSLSILKNLLKTCQNEVSKLIIASSTYEISGDREMIDVAMSCLEKIDNPSRPHYIYDLIPSFYYLKKFENPGINELIKGYTNHKEYLVRYNAKSYLGLS